MISTEGVVKGMRLTGPGGDTLGYVALGVKRVLTRRLPGGDTHVIFDSDQGRVGLWIRDEELVRLMSAMVSASHVMETEIVLDA